MKKKHWLAALLLLLILAAAFFLSGEEQKGSTADISSRVQKVSDTAVTSAVKVTEAAKKEQDRKDTKKEDSSKRSAANEKTSPAPEHDIKSEKNGSGENTESGRIADKAGTKKKRNSSPTKQQKQEDKKTAKQKTDNKASGNEKDKYLTDPVPKGKPEPVEWQKTSINKKEKLTCTLSVTCQSILNHMDQFNKDKLEVLPEDGIIYKSKEVTFYEGESVFDVLLREMKKNKIHMEFEMTPIYNSNYIEGIHNIYEFDCGELSGWMYRVNGWYPNYGCSRYTLKDQDVVEWIYTCDLGRDIGGGTAAGGDE